ncbi:MAG: SAP domain-containing protein, partial [Fusobacteriaceae bacterium]
TIDEKITIFNECLEEGLIQEEETRETQHNYFSKLKVAELQNILQEKKLENSEKTKKVLIDRILENINLNDYIIEQVYKSTELGIKFRASLELKK